MFAPNINKTKAPISIKTGLLLGVMIVGINDSRKVEQPVISDRSGLFVELSAALHSQDPSGATSGTGRS